MIANERRVKGFLCLLMSFALCVFQMPSASATYIPITVEEADSSPSAKQVKKIKVSNGSLTDDGNGTVTITTSSTIADDSLDFDKFVDTLALDASTSITADNAEVLSIVNTGTGNSFLVEDQSSDATPFVIDNAGNAAIGGSASATYKLDITGTDTSTSNFILSLRNSTTQLMTLRNDGAWVTQSDLNFAAGKGPRSISSGANIVFETGGGSPGGIKIDTTASNGANKDIMLISGGKTGIGPDTSPDYTLELSASASSDPLFALSDGDVAHGLTTLAQTDVFALSAPLSSTAGGMELTAISDTDAQALSVRGVMGSTDPTDATAAIKIIGAKSNGTTGIADLAAGETVFQIANNDNGAAVSVLGDNTLQLGANGAGGKLLVYNELGATDRTVTVQPSASQSASYSLTLPTALPGSTQFLQSDNAGVLSWASATVGADSLDFIDLEDTLDLDAATEINLGANEFAIDLDSTGDFVIKDGGAITNIFEDDGDVAFGASSATARLVVAKGSSGLPLDIRSLTDGASNQVAVFRANDRATAANNDEGYISYYLDDSNGTSAEFARLTFRATDVTNTSKDAYLGFSTMSSNSLSTPLALNGNSVILSDFSAQGGYVNGQGPQTGFPIGGAGNGKFKFGVTSSTSTLSANDSAAGLYVNPAWTETGSGTHPLIANIAILPGTITDAAASVTNTAGLYIENAPSATVTGANYALWVDSGTSRFDGDLGINDASPDATFDIDITAGTKHGMGLAMSTTTTGAHGLDIDYMQSDDADATDTNAGIYVHPTSSSGDADNLYGIHIGSITAGAASERGLLIGNGWDSQISLVDSDATHFTNFKTGNQSADLTYTLPTANANGVLQNNGSGVLSWATSVVGADSLDFIDLEDTLDLDAALILNQGTNTMTQNFTGTTTTGLTYNANSLTSGSALRAASSAAANVTGALASFALTDGTGASSMTGPVVKITNAGTANANAALMVTNAANDASAEAFRVNDDGTDTDSTPFIIDENGRVGIGLASVNAKVDISNLGAVVSDTLGVTQTSATDGINAIELAMTQMDDADATDTNAAINIAVTSSSGDAGDVLQGLNFATITGGAATERAIQIGDGWDSQLSFLESGTSPQYFTNFKAGDQAGDITYTLPTALPGSTGVLQSTSGGVLSWATSSGANTALSNLASVAINTSLISDTDSTDDLGSAAIAWKDVYADTYRSGTGNPLVLDSASGVLDINDGTIDLSTQIVGVTLKSDVTNGLNFDSDTLSIDALNNRVGIGTNAPDRALEVNQTFSTPASSNYLSEFAATGTGASSSANGFGAVLANTINSVSGTGASTGYGFASSVATTDDAGESQDVIGFVSAALTHPSDSSVGFYVSDNNSSTGGTQYGIYIALDDTDVSRYGIFQQTVNSNVLMGPLQLGGDGQDGQLILFNELGATDYSNTFNPSGTQGANITYTLPPDDGATDTFLRSDGNGVLTWATPTTTITDDSLDFAKFEDTLDLDAALILNQGTNTWTQNFTGTTTDGLTYNGGSLTTGSALVLNGPSGGTAGITDAVLKVTSDVGNTAGAGGAISSTATADGTTDANNLFLKTIAATSSASVIAGIDNRVTDATNVANDLYGMNVQPSKLGNTATGTHSVYGVYSNPIGTTSGTSTGYAFYASAISSDTNYAFYGTGGDNYFSANTGIGDTSADARLDIDNTTATLDSFGILHSSATNGVNAVEIDFTQLDDADATDTNQGIAVVVTSSSGDADKLHGITIESITAGAATERALVVGTGWDYQLSLLEMGASPTYFTHFKTADQTQASDIVYTLPPDDGGIDTFLKSDGSGILSWATPSATVADDSLDFAKFEDTLDLDAALIVNQGTNTWTQNFTGTTTDGLTYNATSLTSGTALAINGPSGGTAGVTDAVLKITSDGGDAGSTAGAGIQSTVTADGSTGQTNNLYLSTVANTSGATQVTGIKSSVTDSTAVNNGLYGGEFYVQNNTNSSTGIHSIYGVYADAFGKSAGTTTAYGVYASAAGADSNYAFYQSNGNNYFQGNTGIGDLTADAKLDIDNTTATLDSFGILHSSATGGVNAQEIAFTQLDDGDATDTNAAINIAATSSSGDAGDVLQGLNFATITGGAATERAIQIGDGWDSQLSFLESGTSPQYFTNFKAGDQAGDISYTLPTALPGSSGFLQSTSGGVLSWTSSSVGADSLDFTDFTDTMALDASTSITADNAEVFSIINTGSGNSFEVHDQGSDTTPFVIDDQGRVGIATNGSLTLGLTVTGNAVGVIDAGPGFQLIDNTAGHDDWEMEADSDALVFWQYVSDTTWTQRGTIDGSGNFGIGGTPDRRLHSEVDDATTNAVTYAERLTHTTSGTPAINIGVGIEFEAETSAGNNEIGATIEAVAVDAGAGTEDFDIVFKNMKAGAAAAETFRIKSTGVVQAANALAGGVVALVDGATIAVDASLGNTFYVETANSRTIGVPSNPTDGQKIIIRWKNTSGGSITTTFSTGSAGSFRFGTTVTSVSATPAGKTDYVGAIYNSQDNKWDIIAYSKGY